MARRMNGPEFREHLYSLAIWRHELAAFAGVSLRTVNRWCSAGAPLAAVRLADAAGGKINGGTFAGWTARRVLSGPTGESYTLEDLRAAHWLKQKDPERTNGATSGCERVARRLTTYPPPPLRALCSGYKGNTRTGSGAVDKWTAG